MSVNQPAENRVIPILFESDVDHGIELSKLTADKIAKDPDWQRLAGEVLRRVNGWSPFEIVFYLSTYPDSSGELACRCLKKLDQDEIEECFVVAIANHNMWLSVSFKGKKLMAFSEGDLAEQPFDLCSTLFCISKDESHPCMDLAAKFLNKVSKCYCSLLLPQDIRLDMMAFWRYIITDFGQDSIFGNLVARLKRVWTRIEAKLKSGQCYDLVDGCGYSVDSLSTVSRIVSLLGLLLQRQSSSDLLPLVEEVVESGTILKALWAESHWRDNLPGIHIELLLLRMSNNDVILDYLKAHSDIAYFREMTIPPSWVWLTRYYRFLVYRYANEKKTHVRGTAKMLSSVLSGRGAIDVALRIWPSFHTRTFFSVLKDAQISLPENFEDLIESKMSLLHYHTAIGGKPSKALCSEVTESFKRLDGKTPRRRRLHIAKTNGEPASRIYDHLYRWGAPQSKSGRNWNWVGSRIARAELPFLELGDLAPRYANLAISYERNERSRERSTLSLRPDERASEAPLTPRKSRTTDYRHRERAAREGISEAEAADLCERRHKGWDPTGKALTERQLAVRWECSRTQVSRARASAEKVYGPAPKEGRSLRLDEMWQKYVLSEMSSYYQKRIRALDVRITAKDDLSHV